MIPFSRARGVGAAIARRSRKVAVAVADRRFAATLGHDPDGPVLVLSPHLDDAVLSCWSVLASPQDVRVVNVFAGEPSTSTPAYWDVVCGARDAREHTARRVAEDRRALALAGRRPENLSFVDWQYRQHGGPPSLRAVEAEIRAVTATVSMVYAPEVVGHAHPDHLLLRSLALALLAAGLPVRTYADLPYCVRPDWPHGVAHERGEPAEVVRLEADEARRKETALRTYETQFDALDRAFPGVLTDPGAYGCEVFWARHRPTPRS